MGKYEITNAQYRILNSTHDSGTYEDLSLNQDNQPVVNVSWEEAITFCQWLSDQNSGWKFRLPTEAEWEYACRAGTKTIRYWGDDVNDDQANLYANVRDITTKSLWSWDTIFNCNDHYAVSSPVGLFIPNKFGLCDVLGNVWEWCHDWYGGYNANIKLDPEGPDSGEYRVIRGGSWINHPWYVRSASRSDIWTGPPKNNNCGFRIVAIK